MIRRRFGGVQTTADILQTFSRQGSIQQRTLRTVQGAAVIGLPIHYGFVADRGLKVGGNVTSELVATCTKCGYTDVVVLGQLAVYSSERTFRTRKANPPTVWFCSDCATWKAQG